MPEVVTDQVNTVKIRSAAALDKKLSDVFGTNITEVYLEPSLTVEENTPNIKILSPSQRKTRNQKPCTQIRKTKLKKLPTL